MHSISVRALKAKLRSYPSGRATGVKSRSFDSHLLTQITRSGAYDPLHNDPIDSRLWRNLCEQSLRLPARPWSHY